MIDFFKKGHLFIGLLELEFVPHHSIPQDMK